MRIISAKLTRLFSMLCIFALSTILPPGQMALAEEQRFLEVVMLFDISLPDGSPESAQKIRPLVSKILYHGLRRRPEIGKLWFVSEKEHAASDLQSRKGYAKLNGVSLLVSGVLETVGNSLFLTLQWSDLESESEDEDIVVLGNEDLSDLKRVEEALSAVSNRLIAAMQKPKSSARRVGGVIEVACYRGGKGVGSSYLDRHITLSLPFLLSERLDKQMSKGVYTVSGYNEAEYVLRCVKEEAIRSAPDVEYRISGDMFRQGDKLVVASRVERVSRAIAAPRSTRRLKATDVSKTRSTNLSRKSRPSLASIPLRPGFFDDKAIYTLPSLIAEDLAGKVVVAIGQDLLRKQKIYAGKVDGLVGSQTRLAVRKFQEKVGLEPTGNFDPATFKALAAEAN